MKFKNLFLMCILFFLLFTACQTNKPLTSNSINASKDQIVCNSPYMRYGTDCCLDQNSNNICDIDEEKHLNEDNETESIEENSEIDYSLAGVDLQFWLPNERSFDYFYIEIKNKGIDLKKPTLTAKIYALDYKTGKYKVSHKLEYAFENILAKSLAEKIDSPEFSFPNSDNKMLATKIKYQFELSFFDGKHKIFQKNYSVITNVDEDIEHDLPIGSPFETKFNNQDIKLGDIDFTQINDRAVKLYSLPFNILNLNNPTNQRLVILRNGETQIKNFSNKDQTIELNSKFSGYWDTRTNRVHSEKTITILLIPQNSFSTLKAGKRTYVLDCIQDGKISECELN